MAVLITCKLMKIRSKMKSLSSGQHFLKSIGPSRADYSHANSLKWAKIKLFPRFYACSRYLQAWWRFDQKWSRYRPDNIFPIICLSETKRQVTSMWIVRSVPKSNSSKILWLSSLPASLVKIRPEMKPLSSGQHFIFRTQLGSQGQVTLMPIVKSWPTSILSEILCLSRYLHVWRRLHRKWSRYRLDNTFRIICLWEIKGQVTLMWKGRSAPK